MSISLFIFIVLFILTLSIKEKRAWPFFLIILWACYVLMGYNTENPDYYNYVVRYDIASYPNTDNLLSLLDMSDNSFQALCKDLGILTYVQYRKILTGALMILFGWFVYRECYWRNLFIAIYLGCYLIIDIVQIRNFEAFIILLPFIPLLAKRSLPHTLIYVGGVLLSATFHFSTIFFILFAFINIKSRKLRVSLIVLLIFILLPMMSDLSDSAVVNRVEDYKRSGVLGALFGVFFVVLNYLMIKQIAKLSQNGTTIKSKTEFFTHLTPQFMTELNFMLLMLIPFYFVNATTGRLFRYTSLLNVMFILNTMASVASYKIKSKLALALMLYILFFALYFIYLKPEMCSLVLNNNSLLKSWF